MKTIQRNIFTTKPMGKVITNLSIMPECAVFDAPQVGYCDTICCKSNEI
jgi:hypothetical protein